MGLVAFISLLIYVVYYALANPISTTKIPLSTVASVNDYGQKCPPNFYGPTCALPKCNDGFLDGYHNGIYFCSCNSPYIRGDHCEIYNCNTGNRIPGSKKCECPEGYEGRFCQISLVRNAVINSLIALVFCVAICFAAYESVKQRRLKFQRLKVIAFRQELERANARDLAEIQQALRQIRETHGIELEMHSYVSTEQLTTTQSLPNLLESPPNYSEVAVLNPPPDYTP